MESSNQYFHLLLAIICYVLSDYRDTSYDVSVHFFMMKIVLFSFSMLLLVGNGVLGQANCLNIDLQKDLIAHFPLNGNAGEAMGSGFDGAVNGAVLTSDRQLNPGAAYVFDGRNDYIRVGDHFDLGTSDFSISCWVNVIKFTGRIPGTNTSGGPVINKGLTVFGSPPRAGYGFSAREFQGEHYFDFYIGGQNNEIYRVGGFGYEENRWYSLIGIKEADSIKFYVDNQFIAGSLIPANINVNTNIPLLFGSIDKLGNDPRGTNYLNGEIDDVRMYKRALSFEERECLVNPCSPPLVDLGDDRSICNNASLILDASHPGSTYKWQDGSTQPMFEVTQSGTYSVEVENICGTRRDTVNVIFRAFGDMMIPNVFTPNGDDMNDYFEIDEKLIGSKLSVFERWGKMVFRNDNYQNDWDGDSLSSGIYYYLITDACGGTYKGWVSILY